MHAFTNQDISKATTIELIDELNIRELELKAQTNKFAQRAIELRIAELQRWLGIHNARATHALEGMSDERLQEIEAALDRDGATTILGGLVRELVGEIRRMQGQIATLFPRYDLALERSSAGPEDDAWPLAGEGAVVVSEIGELGRVVTRHPSKAP